MKIKLVVILPERKDNEITETVVDKLVVDYGSGNDEKAAKAEPLVRRFFQKHLDHGTADVDQSKWYTKRVCTLALERESVTGVNGTCIEVCCL